MKMPVFPSAAPWDGRGKEPSHWPITLTNGCAAILNIFLPIALVRILSPDQMGRYKVFFLYVLLGPGLSMTAGILNGLYHWMGKYPESKPEVRQSWTLFIAMLLAFSALGQCFSRPLASLIQISLTDFRILMLAMPFAMAAMFMEDLLIARGDIWQGSWYSAGSSLWRTSCILAAAWLTRSVPCIFWTFFAVSVFRVVVGWKLNAESGELSPVFSSHRSSRVLRYAFPVSLSGVASIGLANVDQMILSLRLRAADFAFYAMGRLSLPPLEILETSVNRVLIPRMARAFADGEPGKAAELFSEAVSELWCFLMPATLGLVLYCREIVLVLFTPRYATAADYLRFYAFTYLFMSIPHNAVARARADGAWILKTTLTFSPLSLLLTYTAAARWGAMGALFSVLGVALALRLYSLTYSCRCFGGSYLSFLPLRGMLQQTAIALAAAATVIAVKPLFHDSRAWFFATGPAFAAIYFAVTYAVFLLRLRSNGGSNVLHLTSDDGLGGNEAVARCIAAQGPSSLAGVQWMCYSSEDGPAFRAKFACGDMPLTVWHKKPGFSVATTLRVLSSVLSRRTRIVHAHNIGPLVYGSFAKILSSGYVRLVLTVHSIRDLRLSRWHGLCYRLFLNFPERIIATSEDIRAGLLEMGANPRRVSVGDAADPAGASFVPAAIQEGYATDHCSLQ